MEGAWWITLANIYLPKQPLEEECWAFRGASLCPPQPSQTWSLRGAEVTK